MFAGLAIAMNPRIPHNAFMTSVINSILKDGESTGQSVASGITTSIFGVDMTYTRDASPLSASAMVYTIANPEWTIELIQRVHRDGIIDDDGRNWSLVKGSRERMEHCFTLLKLHGA